MKKILLITFTIVLIGGGIGIWKYAHHIFESKMEIVDLSKIERGTRWNLLDEMTGINRKSFDEHQTFLLDDKDPSTKVVIGVYKVDYESKKPGGIIMLKRLPNGKDAIYWEIASPMLIGDSSRVQAVQDINGDGLKEIITESDWGGRPNGYDYTTFWILSLDPKTKTYKVLNTMTDEHHNVETDFNFEHPNPPHPFSHLNQLEVDLQGTAGVDMSFQDMDSDGVMEIVIRYPYSPSIPSLLYKWDGARYFFWKQTTEKVK